MLKTALIAGASGLVGGHLLTLLLEDNNYQSVIAVGRAPLKINHTKLIQVIADFQDLDRSLAQMKADHLFCCLGTTIKKAGSKEAFYQVDHDYPLALAQVGQNHRAEHFLLVSALGANPDSGIFYHRVKGAVERDIKALNYPSFTVLRPSLLLGDRQESRLGERLAIGLAKSINPLLIGSWSKYRGIPAQQVAQVMLKQALRAAPGTQVLESDQIAEIK